MGREAQCLCEIGLTQVHAKVLLESATIIVCGRPRRIIPLSSITELRMQGSKLLFRSDGENIGFELGRKVAHSWLAALQRPPTTLAQKLGISSATRVRVLGSLACAQLSEAIAVGSVLEAEEPAPEIIVAHVESQSSLHSALHMLLSLATQGGALWIVFAKGPSQEIAEKDIRQAGREAGLQDTKVASVSPLFTALRFTLTPVKPTL